MSEIEREFRALARRMRFIHTRIMDRTKFDSPLAVKCREMRDAINAEYGPRLAREIYWSRECDDDRKT